MTPRTARRLGRLAQALLLGTLLAVALLQCIAAAEGLTRFVYQGF